MLIDTHCHIHDHEFFTPEVAEEVYQRAVNAGMEMFCVGTSQSDSRAAIDFVASHDKTWAIVGVHPHEAKHGVADIGEILRQYKRADDDVNLSIKGRSIIGIGEIGLDYYYNHSPRDVQIAALEQQLQWAMDYDLPVSFHVREAYDDFSPIFDNFRGIRGVLHSFTDTAHTLERGFERGLYVGVNGISTFTRDTAQQEMFRHIPVDRMLFETDAPFLTPKPMRGKVNEVAYVEFVAQFHAELRGISLDEIAEATTRNARNVFWSTADGIQRITES